MDGLCCTYGSNRHRPREHTAWHDTAPSDQGDNSTHSGHPRSCALRTTGRRHLRRRLWDLLSHKQYHGTDPFVLRLLSLYEHHRTSRRPESALDLRWMPHPHRRGIRLALEALRESSLKPDYRPSHHRICGRHGQHGDCHGQHLSSLRPAVRPGTGRGHHGRMGPDHGDHHCLRHSGSHCVGRARAGTGEGFVEIYEKTLIVPEINVDDAKAGPKAFFQLWDQL